MGLSVDEIAGHADFHGSIRRQAQAMLQLYETNKRLASVFATQQRWLMAHVGFALHFRRDPLDQRSGLHAARFFEVIGKHQVASRNTADAFIKEMQKYKFVRYLPEGRDKRLRPLEPTEASLEALFGWLLAHLATLDGLDGGDRLQRFMAATDTIAAIQPRIADALFVDTCRAAARADILAVHLAQQWRHRHGLADIGHAGSPTPMPNASPPASPRSPRWPNGSSCRGPISPASSPKPKRWAASAGKAGAATR